MLTREENELLTRVGRRTPCGELLRRYWHPVAAAGELTEEKPIKAVKILGQELVVYRDKQGKHGLVGEHCPHRLASLAYGRVDDEGIRCPYHGWKFDGAGKCLEQPAEPANSTFKDRIKHVAYPVEVLGGLIFAYLGPGAAAFVAALGCARLGKRQALDRQGIDHRLQLAATDGEFGGPGAFILVAWGYSPSRAPREAVC